ncbi:hypothetical protein [Vibrio hepatarius]|uniref:hypothetical protein n=1 Tax=Vibrio hepatarius TaxID=171383 RepID=UPI003735E9EF
MFNRRSFVYAYSILLISTTAYSSQLLTRSVKLSTEIDNNKFFSYRIERFEFSNNNLVVEVDPRNNQLKNQETRLIIKTSIPSSSPIVPNYEIIATNLVSSCKRLNGDEVVNGFAKYYINGIEINSTDTMLLDDFYRTDAYLWVDKKFEIIFDSIGSIVDFKNTPCSGEVVLNIGLDF